MKSEVVTAATIVARINVNNKPYDDQKVRNALQMAVDNAVVLQLGYGNAGTVAENHHVCADPSRSMSSCPRRHAMRRAPRS